MGYYEDHLFSVAARWAKKYQESGKTFSDFCNHMENVLTGYGWRIDEVKKMEDYIRKAAPQ